MSCPMNFYTLGSKGPAGELPLNLGSCHVFRDTVKTPTGGVRIPATGIDIYAMLVKSSNATPMAPGAVVKWDTAAVGTTVGSLAGATEIGCGIIDPFLTTNVAQNEVFYIIRKGRVQATAGAAITIGAQVIPGTGGKLITMTADVAGLQARCGRAAETATADTQVKYFFVDFQV
jgi:hypothetical protein